ncbi:MAG: hypothetical protein ABFR35_08875 [Thermodesulfobacteriota bacterium]
MVKPATPQQRQTFQGKADSPPSPASPPFSAPGGRKRVEPRSAYMDFE